MTDNGEPNTKANRDKFSAGWGHTVGKPSSSKGGGPVYGDPGADISAGINPAELRQWVERPPTKATAYTNLPTYQDFNVMPDPTRPGSIGFTKRVPEKGDIYDDLMRASGAKWQPNGPTREIPQTEAVRNHFGPLFRAWYDGPWKLEKPHRCAHKAIEAAGFATTDTGTGQSVHIDTPQMQIIQVEHDWAALLGNAQITGEGSGAWALPYDAQVFEFAISGAAVVFALFKTNLDGNYAMSTVFRLPNTKSWMRDKVKVLITQTGYKQINVPGLDDKDLETLTKLYDFAFKQIRALCIMLEAEVAKTTPTRAPYKGAEPSAGKPLPKFSHHTVELLRKPRADRPDVPVPTGRHPRLHFRRGHWRHYTNHRTWIKWTLVGNPDLGFVDKHYRA